MPRRLGDGGVRPWQAGRMGGDGAALPVRQTWYPTNHQRNVRGFAVGSGLMAVVAVVAALVSDGWLSLIYGTLFGMQSVSLGVQARWHVHTRLEADASGLHVVVGRSVLTCPWNEVTEIRPSIVRGRRHTSLVAVRERGLTVDLPVTEEHLAELRRWHRTAR